MQTQARHFRGLALGAAILATSALPLTAQADEGLPLRLSAVAVNLSGVGRPGAQTLELVIERWSTDAEQQKLIDTLVEKSDDALLGVVQKFKPRAGYIRTQTSLGWDLQFARMEELPGGGRRLFLLTDRPMSFYERANNTRSSQYEFLVCEIHLHPDGKGEGKLENAAKVSYDKSDKTLEIENYGFQPVRLTTVSIQK